MLGGCASGGSTASDPAAASPSASASPSDPSTASAAPSSAPPTVTTPPLEPSGPPCGQVWTKGGRIPGGYRGCLEGGAFVKARTRRCASGQVLITYGDRYYGARGYPVNDVGSPLEASSQYRSATRSCG